jgi:hypothetical protein
VKSAITVVRSPLTLRPDPHRLITKPYLISDQAPFTGKSRAERMIDRITALSPSEVRDTLDELRTRFIERHADLDQVFMEGFAAAVASVPEVARVPDEFRLLIGAYFVHEYSIEGAALTNPSIVPAPDQGSAGNGSLEVVVSLRAVGEGHISAIEFRTGVVGADGAIDLDVPGPPTIGDRRPPTFQRAAFAAKLDEMGVLGGLVGRILDSVDDWFTLEATLSTGSLLRTTRPRSRRSRPSRSGSCFRAGRPRAAVWKMLDSCRSSKPTGRCDISRLTPPSMDCGFSLN